MILKSFKHITGPQFVMDHIVSHLIKQGKRSVKNDGMCMYRGSNRCACAAGCMIPGYAYDKRMECATIHNLLDNSFWNTAYYKQLEPLREYEELIARMQTFHDTYWLDYSLIPHIAQINIIKSICTDFNLIYRDWYSGLYKVKWGSGWQVLLRLF